METHEVVFGNNIDNNNNDVRLQRLDVDAVQDSAGGSLMVVSVE